MGRNLGPLNIKDSYEGLVQISGSQLTDGSGSLIPSLDVTASAANQVSASIDDAALPRRVMFRDTAAGYDEVLTNDGLLFKPSTGILQTTSSFALTASFAENVVPTPTGSFMVTGSVTDATLTFTKGDASTFPLTVNNVANAVSSSHSVNSDTAISASYAVTASYAENASVGTLQEVTDAGSTTTTAITTAGISAGSLISRDGFTVTGSADQIKIVDNGDLTKNINVSWEENNNSLEFDSSGTITGATFVIDETTFTKTQLSNISASGYISASEFIGDGSGLTNLPGATAFPFTGSAEITGSLEVIGNITTGNSTNNNTGTNNAIIGGTNSSTGFRNSVVLGGDNNTATSFESATIGGINNTNNAGRSVIVGCSSNSITANNTEGVAILGANSATISGNHQTANVIVGGGSLTIDGDDFSNQTRYNILLGGKSNQIRTIGSLSGSEKSFILGGEGNEMVADLGDGTYLQGSGIIGGLNHQMINNRSVIIGGTNITSSADNTVYVPNLNVSGSIKGDDLLVTGHPDNIATGLRSAVVGGGNTGGADRNEATGTESFVAGGHNNVASGFGTVTIGGKDSSTTTSYSATIGGRSHSNGGEYGLIGGGNANTTNASYASIIGGLNNQATAQFATVISGNNNTASHSKSVVIGGQSLSTTKADEVVVPHLNISGSLTDSDGNIGTAGQALTSNGTDKVQWATVGGGGAAEWEAGTAPSSSVSVLNNEPGDIAVGVPHSLLYSSGSAIAGGDGWSSVIGGFDNQITAGASGRNTIVGGAFHTISGNYFNGMFAGESNTISSRSSVTIGGDSNSITSSGGDYSAIVAGRNNTISGGSFGRSAIVGGENNTINGHLKSVIIGGDSLSTTKSNEVVVPSLDINGTVVQSVQALTITSNTASLDASTGQMFTLGLQNATDTHLEISNQVAGQTFSLKITNNATSAGTITFDPQFDFEDGTAFTATAATNAVDILTFTTFDGTSVQCVGSKNFS